MKEVTLIEFKNYLRENNLLNKGMAAPMADLIVYEIAENIVAKIELPNYLSGEYKYFIIE